MLRLPALFLLAAGISTARADDPPPHADNPSALQTYLGEKMLQEITSVTVTADQVIVRGDAKEDGLELAEVPMEKLLISSDRYAGFAKISPQDGHFEIHLPRKRGTHDRLLSKWQLVTRTEDGVTWHSHARYADQVASRTPNLPAAQPKTKKGLGGWSADRGPAGELETLGISAITVNVMVQSVISLEDGPGRTPFDWEGHHYFANEAALAGYDHTFQEAAKSKAMVSAILLVPNPAKSGNDPVVKMMGHPEAATDGIFSMPDVASSDGLAIYTAALNLMAERWSRADGSHGRVHHWILHNEVDAGWTWTNCGVQEPIAFMDLYHRSMRAMQLIARQYDPHAKAFISLTHNWNNLEGAHYYTARSMVDLLAKFSAAEGNFDWGLAYHPYPQSLLNPRTWEDSMATFSFDTKKITPRNLEVLDAYFRRPELLGTDGKPRTIHLSENGFNSPDYSEASLRDQAAGMAYAWKKIEKLDTIQSWQYHNWIDNRGEGGLKIGLRKFPDEPGHELEPKPIWHLYKALATPDEDRACAPYLKVTGLSSWDKAREKFTGK